MFEILELKPHAYNKFVSDFEDTALSAPKFPDLAGLVYESTSAHDFGLRAYFTVSCIRGYKTVSKVPGFALVIQRHEPLCWYLGKKMETEINVSDATSQNRQATIQALETRLRDAQCQNTSMTSRLNQAQELVTWSLMAHLILMTTSYVHISPTSALVMTMLWSSITKS